MLLIKTETNVFLKKSVIEMKMKNKMDIRLKNEN